MVFKEINGIQQYFLGIQEVLNEVKSLSTI